MRVHPSHRTTISRPRPLLPMAFTALVLCSSTNAWAQSFTDIGLDFGLPSTPIASSSSNLIAAVSLSDLDLDGDLDLVANTPSADLAIYYRNGDIFELGPPLLSGPRPFAETFGHAIFDMDRDGDPDLLVGRGDGDRLFDNTPRGFVEVTDTHLPRAVGWSSSITPADIDGDGDLDLLIARYIERVDFPAHRCFENRILENDGLGRFRDISESVGIDRVRGCSFTMVALDFDDDLDLDILTVNDFTQYSGITELWRNEGRRTDGSLRFDEVSSEVGLVAPLYGMGAAFEDLDQNGRPEIFITNIGEPLLFEWSPADQRFEPVLGFRQLFIRFAHDRHQVTWTARVEDLDGDGLLDILAAGGNLPAAPFIGNPTDMGSLFLRGMPDGRLLPVPRAEDLPRSQHSARDFHIADLDGDARPEIVAAHIHGGLSVFRNHHLSHAPTRVSLRPSMTGPNPAGSLVSVECSGEKVTRRVSGGGDYGSASESELRFYWRNCAPGTDVSGTIRWPSGFLQSFELQAGQGVEVVEPSWLTWEGDLLKVDLGQHLGHVETLMFGGVNLDFTNLENQDVRKTSARVSVIDPSREGILDLIVNGRSWGLHPRIPGRRPQVRTNPTYPISGQRTDILVSWLSDPGEVLMSVSGQITTLEPVDGANHLWRGSVTFQENPRIEPVNFVPFSIDTSSETILGEFELEPDIDEERSEILPRELHILAVEAWSRRVRLRLRLVDRNGAPVSVTMDRLGVQLNGYPIEPDLRVTEAGLPTLVIEHIRLGHRDLLQVTLDGLPILGPQRVAQLGSPDELGTIVSIARSRCFISEVRLRADGADRGTAIIQLNDAAGHHLPDFDIRPGVSGTLVTPLRDTLVRGFSGWSVEIQAQDVAGIGTLQVTIPNASEPIVCRVGLVPPPPLPPPESPSTIVALSDAVVGEPLVVRFWPLDVSGRSLGSGVSLVSAVEGAQVISALRYVGLGRYEQAILPESEALEFVVQGPGQRELARLRLEASGGEAAVEPGPEPSPEESPIEEDPMVEPVEPVEVEEVEASTEVADVADIETADLANTDNGETEEFPLEASEEVDGASITEPSRRSKGQGCVLGRNGGASDPVLLLFGLCFLTVRVFRVRYL